jgi:type IV secretory pathway TrbL component
MNWKKWLSKQVRRGSAGGGRRIRSLLSTLSGCAGGRSGCTQPQTKAARSTGNWLQRLLANRGNCMSTTNTQASRLLDELMARLDQAVREDGPRSPQAKPASTVNPAPTV